MRKNILCFGDSNTWGANPNTQLRWDYDERWTGLLAKELGNDYLVIEDGLSGRTSVFEDPITPNRAGIKDIDLSLEIHSPLDLVIIMLGTNDTKTYFSASSEIIAMGVGKVAERAVNHVYYPSFRRPKILLVSPILIEKGSHELSGCLSFDDTSHLKSLDFASLLKKEAERLGIYFFDASTVSKAGVDALHMDYSSHLSLSKALKKEIIKILESEA